MRRYWLRTILVYWLITITNFGQAEEYVVGVEKLNFLPYYSGINGSYYGYARDVLDAFGRAYGHQFKYRPLPVERLFLAFINQQVDLKFPDSPNWQSDLKQGHAIIYSDSLAPFTDGIMVTPHNQEVALEAFKKLGTIRGFTPWPFTQRIDTGEINVYENNSIPGLLMQTALGRVDGSYINVSVAQYHLKYVLKKPEALVFNPNLAHDRGYYFLSTIKYPELVEQLDHWLKENAELVLRLQQEWNISQP